MFHFTNLITTHIEAISSPLLTGMSLELSLYRQHTLYASELELFG